ncbi:MAG TPA: PIN domain-containing protein [Pseudomonadota bacterium]|jgi:predicted nucleic acid-binding protein|nr:PIN domain-containing protein [Pseudomonadota bacterium]
MSSMVDTHILSYALYLPNGREDAKLAAMIDCSKQLIRISRVVRVSSPTWTEICRFKAPTGERAVAKLAEKIRVIPLTGAMASRAAELLDKRNKPESVCKKCLNSKAEPYKCVQCSKLISPQQRIADAMIAASAELTKDIDTLYSYDGGLLEFAPHVKRIRIVEPDQDHGPLWERLKHPSEDASPSAVT